MKPVLQTYCLTKKYGKEKAVNNVSLNIEKGDIYGLIGKNGAGKTTIMKIVCGLISQDQGDIKLFGSGNLKRGRKRIGATIEQPALYPNMTARENLLYYNKLLGNTDYSNIQEILGLVGLESMGKKKTKSFSMGMKQRLSIAISLIGNPDFLILDEPTNGLDPLGIKQIRELLLKLNYENNITILISSHILGELDKIATRYGVMKNGTLINEFSAYELEKTCEKCISLVVNDSEKAAYIIKNIIKSNDYEVLENGIINIYDFLNIPDEINKVLVENNVLVSSLTLEDSDIESYFVKMMGEG